MNALTVSTPDTRQPDHAVPARTFTQQCMPVILLAAIASLPAASGYADHWTLTAMVNDASTQQPQHPPDGLQWKCIYSYQGSHSCGGPFTMGETIEVDLPVRPSALGVSDGFVVDGQETKTYYRGSLWTISSPNQHAMVVGLGAYWGNVWGIVRLPAGTPLPGVIVAAYTTDGQLVAQARTDEDGRYEFAKSDATEIEQLNHWVLPVDFHTQEGGFNSRVYRLAPSSMGAVVPDDGSNPWTRVHVVHASRLSRQDIVVGLAQSDEDSNEHDDQCDEEEPEDDEKECEPAVPSGAGMPVHLVTGSVYLGQPDAALSGTRRVATLTRRYNSRRAYFGKVGAFGRGWTHSFEKSITEVIPGRLIRLNKGDSAPVFLQDEDQDGVFRPDLPAYHPSWIERTGDSYVRHFPQGGEERYGSSGLLLEQVDRVGNTTRIDRDGEGKVTSITAPGGRALNFSYEGDRVVRMAGPEGTIATYSYAGNDLDHVTYVDGSGYSFHYDESGQLLSASDLGGRTLESHTYSVGRALTSEIADGDEHLTFSLARPVLGGAHQTTVTDALGNRRVYSIGDRGGIRSVTAVAAECSTCENGSVQSSWTFDAAGRLGGVSTTDGSSEASVGYVRDASGFVLASTLGDGTRTEYTRDALGRPLTRTDPLGGVSRWTHGPAGALSSTDPLGRTTTFEYGTAGLVSAVVDPAGHRRELGYNTWGDLTSVTDPLGNTYRIERDNMGRSSAVVDPNQRRSDFGYDTKGRLTSIVRPGALRTELGRDEQGRVRRITRPGGVWTEYEYDAQGRVQAVRDARTGVMRLEYDRLSRLIALTDPNGNATRVAYDPLGRVTSVVHPLGGQETFAYDGAGRLLRWTNRNGVVTTYTRDGAGRPTRRSFSDETPAVRYAYDQAGRLASAANGSDTLTWTYDPAGQLVTERSSRNGTTVSYSYSKAGRMTGVSLDGTTLVSNTFDDAGRLTRILIGPGEFVFSYDPASVRTSLTAPNGVVTTYSYDEAYRLSDISAVLGSVAVSKAGYGYDGASNRISKDVNGLHEAYGYDGLERLASLVRGGERTDWNYDRVGNRLTEQTGGQLLRSTYDHGNRLTARQGGGSYLFQGQTNEGSQITVNSQPARLLPGNAFEVQVEVSPGTNRVMVEATDPSGNVRRNEYEFEVTGTDATYSYDAEGALIGRTEGGHAWVYDWNADGKMVAVTKDGSEAARFEYDPLGRRIRKVASGTSTIYTYEGMDVLRETRNDGIAYTYVHGSGIDEPLARIDQSGAVAHYHADGLGSIVKMTDSRGNVIQTRQYDPWGNLEVGADQPGYAFTGREWDPETGLYYYRARYYDPKIGRFISEDPIGFAASEVNLYGYVGGNPVSAIDPLGLATIPDPNGIVPGGPWTPNNAPGARPGNFLGPSQGGRPQVQWVPPEGEGGPPGSEGYWKKNQPGQKGWDRYDQEGNPKTPEEVHPNPQPTEGEKCRVRQEPANACVANPALCVAGAAGAGYLAYRAVRMVPSLFPPFWWTIPVNAALP
jgi:RHS repeat-associated protein